jgi:fructose-bisphosphate aldolase class II
MKQILDEAEKGKYGVGAFNMNNMEQLQAIMDAAVEKKSPVILQVSEGALEYSGMDALPAMLKAMVKQDKYRDVKVALHLDHGRTLDACKKAIDLGFTSVMYDGSLDATGKKQQGYQDNVRKTREVVEYAHKFGVTVEGELGALGGSDEQKAGKIEFTDPDQAGEFVKLTGVDCLAISIGTSHGAYKFVGEPKLDLERVPKIKAKTGGVTLVMHGSSSVPREMVDAIDEYAIMRVTADEHGDRWVSYKKGTPSIEKTDTGDKPVIKFEDRKFKLSGMTPDVAMQMTRDLEDNHRLARAMGVPTQMIQKAVSGGIQKINIDTDGRLAFTLAMLQSLFEKPDNFDQRKYLGRGRDAIRVWVGKEMEYFGSMGHNGDYQSLTLDDMKKQYSKTAPAMLSTAQVEDILAKQPTAVQRPGTAQRPEKLT